MEKRNTSDAPPKCEGNTAHHVSCKSPAGWRIITTHQDGTGGEYVVTQRCSHHLARYIEETATLVFTIFRVERIGLGAHDPQSET